MKQVKIAIIGAGSGIFSINLIKDLCVNENLKDARLTLMDVDERRLDGIYSMCVRYAAEINHRLDVSKTTDRIEAITGADFVINVALDYGHARLREGWRVAMEHGYRFGGSLHVMHDEAFWVNFHQLRLMESIAQDVLRVCPKAWLVMVANPVLAGITYLTRRYPELKVVGMCHGFNGTRALSEALGFDHDRDVRFETSGVNHFVWLTSFQYRDQDAYPILDRWLEDGGYEKYLEAHRDDVSPAIGPKSVDLYRRYGVFPIGDTSTPGGGAWGWWYHAEDEKQYQEDPFTWYEGYFKQGEKQVQQIRDAVDNPDAKMTEVFSTLASGEPMIPLIESLAGYVAQPVVVNVPNTYEYVPGLPKDFAVEITAMVSERGIQGIHMLPQPKAITALTYRDRIDPVETELLAFQTGDIHMLESLVMMDPWTHSLKQARELIDAILDLPCNADMKAYFKAED